MKLLIKEGPNSGQEVDLEGATVLGRDPASATLVIEDPEASRRHASVAPSATGVTVEDLGSTNGTFVNGERVEGRREAGVGDEIRVGNTVLVVQSTVEATRMSEVPAPADPGVTATGDAPADTSEQPAAPEPPVSPQSEPGAAEPPAPPPPPEPAATPPPAPEPPAAPPPPPPVSAPAPPPGAGQGYGAPPQQAYPPVGQPGGAMAPAGFTAASPIKTRESVVEWLLCIFVPFYSLFWIHRASKEMQQWSGGRIGYSAGATIAALTIGSFILVPPFVAIFSFGGRIRRAQELAGVQPRASGIGFFGRLLLLGYGYKWAQDQFNELAVRAPQG